MNGCDEQSVRLLGVCSKCLPPNEVIINLNKVFLGCSVMLYEDRSSIQNLLVGELIAQKGAAKLANQFARQWLEPRNGRATKAKAMLNLIKLVERMNVPEGVVVKEVGDKSPLIRYWLERLTDNRTDVIL